jgi:hypothetical protein
VILFTFYPVPFDAEKKQGSFWHDFKAGSGISFGVSLSSPGNNFYLGVSSEIRRLVQLVYGLNAAKVTTLARSAFAPTTGSPVTVQTFSTGVFVGLTFNITGFIQGGSVGGSKSSSTGQ